MAKKPFQSIRRTPPQTQQLTRDQMAREKQIESRRVTVLERQVIDLTLHSSMAAAHHQQLSEENAALAAEVKRLNAENESLRKGKKG